MEILSLPVGLVIGLFPVIVDLGPQGGHALLKLDDRTVCEVSSAAPACMVDLGALPRVHALDLERIDSAGRVVESIRRYLNRGISGTVRAVGACDDDAGVCDFGLQWAHPAKAVPVSIDVTVDGKKISVVSPRILFPDLRSAPPQVLSIEASFPDGGRAEFTRLLHGSYSEDAEARLRHVELEADEAQTGPALEAALRGAGWKLRTVEQGAVEVLFVLEPGAFDRREGFSIGTSADPFRGGDPIAGVGPIRYLVAREFLGVLDADGVRKGARPWWRQMVELGSRSAASRVRVADAVAAGGFRLGAAPRRRILVLVLAGGSRERSVPDRDASTFSARGALAYLSDAGVPIVVWRTGADSPSDWPAGRPIHSADDLARAAADLRRTIDRQWIAWREGVDDRAPGPDLPAGLSIAGRAAGSVPPASPSTPPDGTSRPAPDVYALAADPRRPSVLVAGTRDGVFATSDAGASWRPVPAGVPSVVLAVAFVGKGGREILAGAAGALLRLGPEPGTGSSVPLPTVQSLALGPESLDAEVLFASARGRLFRSADGGRRWTGGETSIDSEYTVTVAVDPLEPGTAYAGTMGGGVFKSADHGRTWSRAGSELQDTGVRCIAVTSSGPRTLYAGTDGGLFVSSSGGARWTPMPGLAHLIVYAVAVDPADPRRLFAGTEDGLRESADAGGSWTRPSGSVGARVVTSLVLSGRTLFAGTLGDGVQAMPLSAESGRPGRRP